MPYLQIPNISCRVYGVSLGILAVGTIEDGKESPKFPACRGEDDIIGLQIGVLFAYARELSGFQVSGLENHAVNVPFGVQVAGFGNSVENEIGLGLQLSLAMNDCASGAGLQMAIVNEADKNFTGVQLGLCNWGAGKSEWIESSHEVQDGRLQSHGHHSNSHQGVDDMRGLQLGLVNKASDMYGVQCGILYNRAKCVRGLQLGLINVTDSMAGIQIGLLNVIKENRVPFLPVINAHF